MMREKFSGFIRTLKGKRGNWLIGGGCIFIFLLIFWYWLPVVRSDAGSLSLSDIWKIHRINRRIINLLDGSGPSYRDSLYSAVLSAAAKELLETDGIRINRQNAVLAVESSHQLKGLLREIKEELGGSYYRLYVEPIAVMQVFSGYYRANDPALSLAESILKDARSDGLETAAKKAGEKTREVSFPASPDNVSVLEAAKGVKEGSILDRVVETPASFMVARLKKSTPQGVTFEVIEIPRTPPLRFCLDALKKKGKNVSLYPVSLVTMEGLLRMEERRGGKG